jgi:type IV secretory pathway TraG/TraD family ATPase VirD4
MPPTLRDVVVAAILFVIGVASATSGVTGIVRDITAVVPARWLPPASVRAPDAVWWLRACLALPRCREAVSVFLGESLAAHARALWCGLLAIAVSAVVWIRILRSRRRWVQRSLGDAHFASGADLRRLTRRSPGAWFPLGYTPRWPLPFLPGRATALTQMRPTMWTQPVWLPEEDLGRHVLVVGLTGAHKTTALTFPVLIEAARAGVSVIALDLKYGEDDSLASAAPEWWRQGRDVLVFAPLDPASLRWNPLAGCRTFGEAHRLATLLFEDGASSHPDLMYWMEVERHVCAALAHALVTDGGAPTLERMKVLCEGGPGAVRDYVHGHPSGHSLIGRLGAFLAMLPKDEAGILQGIASRLEAWGDEAVCRATGGGEPWEQIDLERLRREPVLLIIGVPQPALARVRWLCHLFLRDLAAHLLRPREAGERTRVVQVLEELPAWGPLPGLADHLATFRSRQVAVIATVQSEAQGEHVYGREGWTALASNLVTKIYFPSLADLDAERLSRALGTSTAPDVALSRGWGRGGARKGEHRHEIPIPLRRPEELHGVGTSTDEICVRLARIPPARLWCPPVYARPEYAACMPAKPPRTVELATYHHLWHRRGGGDPDHRRAPAPSPDPLGNHAATHAGLDASADPQARAPHPGALDHGPLPISAPTPTAEEIRALSQFVLGLLDSPTNDPQPPLRGVHRGVQLVEVRVAPAVAVRLCGSHEAMHAIVRRWSVLRWVRRVRPLFVLERRALEALDADLVRRLAAACGPNSG